MLRKQQRGAFSLPEALVSMVVGGGLLLLVCLVFRSEALLSSKVTVRTDLLQALRVVLSRFTNDGIASSGQSTLVLPTFVSFPSRRNLDDVVQFAPGSGEPLWQSFRNYYWNASDRTVCCSRVAMPLPDPQAILITDLTIGGSVHPASFYATGGSVLAHSVDSFEARRSDNAVTLTLAGSELRRGSNRPEPVQLSGTVLPRS